MSRFELTFVSLVALFLGLILLIIGAAFAFSPYSTLLLRALAHFKTGPLFGGLSLIGVGLSLLLSFYTLNRRRFLHFRAEGYSISEKLLTELAQNSLRNLYPEAVCDVVVKRGKKIEVTAHLPVVEEELPQIELLLKEAFEKKCGFKDSFKVHLLAPEGC